MPNPGNKEQWGNELVILPRRVKTKGIHPSESGFQKREKNLGNLRYGKGQNDLRNVDPKCSLRGGKIQTKHPSHQS